MDAPHKPTPAEAAPDTARVTQKASDDAARVTPMMEQFIEIKAANPDCLLFYRMGDFYEMFFEDAEIASRALGIVLTKRGKHLGNDIPMCGVPVERSDEYLHKLIALGHRVAVCEQTGGSGRSEEAWGQERRAARRGPPRHARHADGRHASRRQAQQLSSCACPRPRLVGGRPGPLRAGLDRHFDRRVQGHRKRRGSARRRNRPDRSRRDHRFRRTLCRRRHRAAVARVRACDAADARRVRRRDSRAPAGGLFQGRDHGELRPAVAARTDRGRGLRHLCRADPIRQATAAVAAVTRKRGCGDW
jgi:hypothetical protein